MPKEEVQETQEQEQQEQPQVDPAIMAQAKLFGYKEDYSGGNKLSPEEYVQRAFERLDIAKGTIKTIERKNADLVKGNEELKSKLDTLTSGFKQFVENSRKSEERAYARAKKELEAEMEKAVEDSDTATYKKAKGRLDDLEAQIKEHPALTGKEPPAEEGKVLKYPDGPWNFYKITPDEYIANQEAWNEENSWYGTEMEMSVYADGVDASLSKSKVGKSHKTQQERLDAITAAVKKKYPEYFGEKPAVVPNGNKRRAAAVEEGGGEGPPAGGGKKTYADLPTEAKATCDQFVKEGIMTKDDYVKNYQFD